MKRRLFRILYWSGFSLALVGVLLRLRSGATNLGLALAVIGVGLVISARIASAIRRF